MTNILDIYKGNSRIFTVDVYDNDGLKYDCTNYIPYFSVKKLPSDSVFLINLTGTTGSTNTLTFDIPSTLTNLSATEYVYDVTIVNGSDIVTVISDTLRILENTKYGS